MTMVSTARLFCQRGRSSDAPVCLPHGSFFVAFQRSSRRQDTKEQHCEGSLLVLASVRLQHPAKFIICDLGDSLCHSCHADSLRTSICCPSLCCRRQSLQSCKAFHPPPRILQRRSTCVSCAAKISKQQFQNNHRPEDHGTFWPGNKAKKG